MNGNKKAGRRQEMKKKEMRKYKIRLKKIINDFIDNATKSDLKDSKLIIETDIARFDSGVMIIGVPVTDKLSFTLTNR